MRKFFVLLGRFEGISLLLLLFVAMPVKYILQVPIFVSIIGSAHGVLFLAYVALLLRMYIAEHWAIFKLVSGLVLSCVPFGTFYFESVLDKQPKKD